MSGATSRRKGAKGQAIAANMLRSRDWTVDQITAGIAAGDLIGTDRLGERWCVEVKNCSGILPGHLKQAKEQAKKRGLRWMLMSKIAGSSLWLVQRQACDPVVWRE